MQPHRHAFTHLDLLLTIVAAAFLMSLTAVVLGGDGQGARTTAHTVRDATHLTQIHMAIVIYSGQFDGMYTRPGLIDRLPDPQFGEIPGRGPEDTTQNTTANLYSTLVMQNYFMTQLPISPVDRNPSVAEKKSYDYEKYDPAADTYWDEGFRADLDHEAHASYAHLVIFGQRAQEHWRNSQDAGFVVLGNRGPIAGEPNFESYTCGPHGQWNGNLIFADNHAEFSSTFHPAAQKPRMVDGVAHTDNIFAMEDGQTGADAVLSFTHAIGPDGAELQYD